MKTTMKSLIAALIVLTALGCKDSKNHQDVKMNTPEEIKEAKKETADIADASFVDGMTGKAWNNYLHIRMALVNSDPEAAKTAASNLAESFGEERNNLKALAIQIAETNALEVQRELFSELNQQLEPLFKDGLGEGTIYKQFCPMAFDNEGAFWFSDVSDIRNPYFGDMMLTCGKVTETITK